MLEVLELIVLENERVSLEGQNSLGYSSIKDVRKKLWSPPQNDSIVHKGNQTYDNIWSSSMMRSTPTAAVKVILKLLPLHTYLASRNC